MPKKKVKKIELKKIDFSKLNREETIEALRLIQVNIGPTNSVEMIREIREDR